MGIKEKNVGTYDTVWHAIDAEEAIKRAGSSPKGLTQAEAAERLVKFGLNRLAPPRKRGGTQEVSLAVSQYPHICPGGSRLCDPFT